MILLAMAAAWHDMRRGIIPNRLLLPGMMAGVLLRTVMDILSNTPEDIPVMVLEVTILFFCLWPVYTTGSLGAGDCKLLLTAGVFLPAGQAVFVVISTFFIAAAEIMLRISADSIKRNRRRIKAVRLAPPFLGAVLACFVRQLLL